jgi:hypothetical protein
MARDLFSRHECSSRHEDDPRLECSSRRIFLQQGGMALVALGFAPAFVGRAAAAAGTRKKLLITVFQRGAVDGLNMVVPYGDAEYYRARPSIAIARPSAGAGPCSARGICFVNATPRSGLAVPGSRLPVPAR